MDDWRTENERILPNKSFAECPQTLKNKTLHQKTLAVGMAEKAKEFVQSGSEIYQDNIPAGAKEQH